MSRNKFIAFLSIFGIAAALMIANISENYNNQLRLDAYAVGLLNHSSDVAEKIVEAISSTSRRRDTPCSAADLHEMRYTRYSVSPVHDIGRIVDNKVACTAGYGVLSTPIVLPPPEYRTPRNVEIWEDQPTILDSRIETDITAKDNVIVFTSPEANFGPSPVSGNINAILVSKNLKHAFLKFGNIDGLVQRVAQHNGFGVLSSTTHSKRCSDSFDFCVLAELKDDGLFSKDPTFLLAVSAMGAAIGGIVGFAISAHLRSSGSLTQRVRRLVSSGRLRVEYQPLVRLSDGAIVGAEALARLTDESNNEIPPDAFIPAAEGTPLIHEITRRIVALSLSDLRSILNRSDFYLSINIDADDAISPSFCTYLNDCVDRAGLKRAQIGLEITERTRADPDALLDGITRLRGNGYRSFLDDFGTGHSNLAYLVRLPVDGIKIDRMFTQAIGTDAVTSTIVEKICATARDLNLRLIAEGIETVEQSDYIRTIAPEAIGQGWLFGKAVPAHHLLIQLAQELHAQESRQ